MTEDTKQPDRDQWIKWWETQETEWESSEVTRQLINHGSHLFFEGDRNYKVLVTLCGRTIDMKWFYDKGCTVVGVDFCLKPLEDFMKEHNLKYSTRKLGDVTIVESEDKRIRLHCSDLMEFLKAAEEKDFDIVYDIGMFDGVKREKSDEYASLMNSIVAPNFRYLFTWGYTESEAKSFPDPHDELNSMFGKYFQIKFLAIEATESFRGPVTEYCTLFSPK